MANPARAIAGEVVEEEEEGADRLEEPSPEVELGEVPGEAVPSEEAGKPPDPPEGEREEVPDAGDEREIEVEGEGVPVRKAKVGTLKAEAKSITHLCTHRYRNPYGKACIRAKLNHYRTERGAFKRESKSWGTSITADFLYMRKPLIWELVLMTKQGRSWLSKMCHRGLPAQCWPFALNCVTHNLNIEDVAGDGDSAWQRMTGEDFKGQCSSSPQTQGKRHTQGSLIRKGCLAFCRIHHAIGQQWPRKCKVWDMAEFAHVNLPMNAAVP